MCVKCLIKVAFNHWNWFNCTEMLKVHDFNQILEDDWIIIVYTLVSWLNWLFPNKILTLNHLQKNFKFNWLYYNLQTQKL